MTPLDARSTGEGTANWNDSEVRVVIDSAYGADLLAEDLAHQGHRALAAAMVAWGLDPEVTHAAIRDEVTDPRDHRGLIESVLMEHQTEGRTSAGATPEHGWGTLCSCGYTASDMPAHQTARIVSALEGR